MRFITSSTTTIPVLSGNKNERIMKKYFAILLAATVAAVACNKESIEESTKPIVEVKYVDVDFTASFEKSELALSKTSIGADGAVSWSDSDQISVFDNSTTATTHNNLFSFAGGQSFTGKLPEDGAAVFALYPQRNNATYADGIITTKLFPEQNAKVGTFADGVAIMAGKVNGREIEFKNLCSHIKFTLEQEGIKSLTLIGNKNEALCGKFEVNLTGEEPVIQVKTPETYVTLRNEDGSALATGDYYFTILPVEFADGFTVILSKNADGSQLAAKTNGIVDKIKTRNTVLGMPAVPAEKLRTHLNYFVKYNDGFPVSIGETNDGGVQFSKESNPGGILVNSTKNNTLIKKDGVYFICNENDPAQIKYNETNGIIVCGVDASVKSKVEMAKTLQPATKGDGVILFENLVISPEATFTGDFITQKKATANPGTSFGSIVFDNCKITTAKNLININNKETSITKVSVLNCDYFAKGATSCVLSFGNMASTVSELNIRNNIFGVVEGTVMTEFKILQCPGGRVSSINVYSNTFDHTTMVTNGCVIIKNVENCYMLYNLFNETVLQTANSKFGNKNGDATDIIEGQVINNYFYTSGTYNLNNSLKPKKSGAPVKLNKTPLSSIWAPFDGQYGTYDIVAVDQTKQPSEAILPNIGAHR